MNNDLMIKKNNEYVIEINSMGYQGEGIGKIGDFTVFAAGALKGEIVKVKLIKVKKSYSIGKVLEIIKPSEDRVESKCSIYKKCGGCSLQHLKYYSQLKYKKERVKECLERIGKLSEKLELESDSVGNRNKIIDYGFILHDTIGMKKPYRYRNKVQLPVREVNGETKIGFYAPRSHDVIETDCCFIQSEKADKVIKIIRQWMEQFEISAYNEENNVGTVRHIMVREGFKTNQVMVVIVTNTSKLPYKKELIDIIKENIDGITSIIQNINNRKTNVILGEKCITLWGKDTITDYIGEFKFNISPLSFFQVNPIQTEVLYSKALEYAQLTGEEVVFDAYCGTGTISLFLSQKAKKVYGVEIVPQAIENANINAKENNIENAEFFVGKSEEVIPKLIEKGIKADVVVVDPPRKGCDKVLLEAIAYMQPKRIVYVSCDPATLARDLGILEEMGYKTLEVQPVDMFPMTSHVETVVRLCR